MLLFRVTFGNYKNKPYFCAKIGTKISAINKGVLIVFGTVMIIGYARVSTQDQQTLRQIDQLKEFGCERIYEEKASGTKRDREELNRMMDALREGDVVIITELSRLSRSVKDLFEIVDKIHNVGADIKSLRESWIDTTTPQGKLLFTIFAGISQFERDLIRQRTMEGLQAARARGRNGGRPPKDESKIKLALSMYDSKVCSISQILETTGISKTTLYRYIRQKRGL